MQYSLSPGSLASILAVSKTMLKKVSNVGPSPRPMGLKDEDPGKLVYKYIKKLSGRAEPKLETSINTELLFPSHHEQVPISGINWQ